MRKSTFLCLALAAFCSTALFHTSQRAHDQREKLRALNATIAKEEESLRVLTAEWSYLNQPARLEKLAKQHLKMSALKGSQFIRVEDIPLRPAATAPEPAPLLQAAAPAPAPAEKKAPIKAAEKKPVKPPVKIAKPAAPLLQKPEVKPAPKKATASTRDFSDLMKSLGSGKETP